MGNVELFEAFIMAASDGDLETLKNCVNEGVDVNDVALKFFGHDEVGMVALTSTALMFATENGDVRIAQELVNMGANLNAQNFSGHTALMIAAARGNSNVIEFLLANGADIWVKSDTGKNAFDFAVKNVLDSGPELINQLHKAKNIGAFLRNMSRPIAVLYDAYVKDWKNVVSLEYAFNASSVKIISQVLSKDLETPFVFCALDDKYALEKLQYLEKSGMKINVSNEAGVSLLSMAASKGREDVVRFLIEKSFGEAVKQLADELPQEYVKGAMEKVRQIRNKGIGI